MSKSHSRIGQGLLKVIVSGGHDFFTKCRINHKFLSLHREGGEPTGQVGETFVNCSLYCQNAQIGLF